MKYGLNLRGPSQQKKQPARPPLPSALGFGDDDENDVERDISRQAGNKKALKEVEELHKKALEEDPSAFAYDEVYEEMLEKKALPVAQDRQERKPRYIQALIEKTKVREREHEIIYERKLAKERSKEDHLFGDKEKFVTGAYKRKLAEQAKWLEEERLRQLREEREDITKKGGDMSEFYYSLSKNVAFGAPDRVSTKPSKHKEDSKNQKSEESEPSKVVSPRAREENHGETSAAPKERSEIVEAKPAPVPHKQEVSNDSPKQESKTESATAQPTTDHHKRNQDAVAAAKERYLARKKAKVN